MIDISSAIPTVTRRIKNLPVGWYIELKTFKKDRAVIILKKTQSQLLITENGFDNKEFFVDASRVKNTLKKLLRREFPRSNKVRIQIGEFHEKD